MKLIFWWHYLKVRELQKCNSLFLFSKTIKSTKIRPETVVHSAIVSTKMLTINPMSATVNIVCYRRKALSNGEYSLRLCICKDRKRKSQSLGISINLINWGFDKN